MAATTSSAILRIWYEPNDEALFVTFVGGKTYAYEACPDSSVVRSSRLNRVADFSTCTSGIAILTGS
jgi:hypothetical protein